MKKHQPTQSHIVIDITCMMHSSIMTGIQRVVKNIIERFLRDYGEEIRLISWDDTKDCFRIVRDGKITGDIMTLDDFCEGITLYEIDAVWCNQLKRSYFLPCIKSQGAKIVVFVHDILGITQSEYCDEANVLPFVECLCAQMQYADHFITSTKETERQMRDLCADTDVTLADFTTVPLAGDFTGKAEGEVSDTARELAAHGPYLFMIGTIEPRKNHSYVLDAMEAGLFAAGYRLVLAGRYDWNVKELADRIKEHPLYGKQLFQAAFLSDADVAYLYRHAFAVAFPSHGEGFGLPVLEAIAYETPIFCSDIPVLREVGGDYAFYCDLADPGSLVEAVGRLSDPTTYQAQVAHLAGYEPMTWDRVAREQYAAIQKGRHPK